VLLYACAQAAIAQTDAAGTNDLQRQRDEALGAIELTTELLNQTQASAKNSLHRLNLLSQQLLTRKKLIAIMGDEIAQLNKKIDALNNDIAILDKDVMRNKENYARSMQNQQVEFRTAQHKMLIILSADNITQSYRRMRYLREYADWQKVEAERIMAKQDTIAARKGELERSLKNKQALYDRRDRENKKLADEENQQRKVVKELNSKQKALQAELQQKRREADALNAKLEAMIGEDIKESEKKSNATAAAAATDTQVTPAAANETTSTAAKTAAAPAASATPTENAKSAYVMDNTELNLANDFAKNKGRLPYPINGKYTVVSHFGEQQHQELTNVRINNDGVDIQTTADAEALAVFKGVVTRVFVMAGFNNNVIIRHGLYLTVYSNLSKVYVKAGDQVSTRQPVGKIFTDAEKGNETILHFQIWKDRNKQNPEQWLR
jgi:septal ring factor EnvC (AmiA/AmiB activator)